MQGFPKLAKYFSKIFPSSRQRDTDPEIAYDLWSSSYDYQPGNLILDLDSAIFADLINRTTIKNMTIADIGCGTGRHWEKIMHEVPKQLIGFDVSEGMLGKLRQKFPGATTHHLTDHHLNALSDNSCDLIISTLALAHIEQIEEALTEWCRILKKGGDIIITDYHPDALLRGANRTFKCNDQLISVKNYIHPLEKINHLLKQLNFKILHFTEKKIDNSVKNYYEEQNALTVFERFKGTRIIYGMHLKKDNAPS